MSFDALIPNMTMNICFSQFFDARVVQSFENCEHFENLFSKVTFLGIWYLHYLQLNIYKIHRQNIDC